MRRIRHIGVVPAAMALGALGFMSCERVATAPGTGTLAVAVSNNVGSYSSLTIDGSGRLHVSHNKFDIGALAYSTCVSACTLSSNWRTAVTDQGSVGRWTWLALDANGRLLVSYHDWANGNLKYLQ